MDGGRTSRDFWLLWGGSTSSNLGDGIRQTAFPLLAVTITTDPLAVGAVTAASFSPWLLSLAGGAAVDRLDRRRLILNAQILRGLAVAGFGAVVLSGHAALALLYLVAFLIGTGEVVVDSALQAAIPHVAGEDLDTANSRFASGQFVAGSVIGGPLGGALFTLSASLPFFIDAATFAIGAWLVWLVSRPLQESTDADRVPTSVRDDIQEGIQFLADHTILRGMTVAISLSNLANAAFSALLVLLVTDVLGGSELAFGLVMAAGASGGLLGSLTGARFVRAFGRRVALIVPFIVMTIAMLVVSFVSEVALVGVGSFLVLYSVGLFNVCGQSIRQRMTPDRLLGRVVAGMRFFAMGAIPLGAVGGGLVARFLGVQETVLVAAAVCVVALAALIVSTAGQDLEAKSMA